MAASIELLRLHLRGLREQLAATGIGVFVPGVLSPEPLLVHEGDAAAAEIGSAAAAVEFIGRQPPSAGWPRLVPGAAPGSFLVTFLGDWCLTGEPGAGSERRRSDAMPRGAGACPVVVLGVVFAPPRAGVPPPADLRGPGPAELSPRWTWAFTSAAAMAVQVQQSEEAINDPLTALPGRSEVFATLERTLRHAEAGDHPFALLLVNPDDFVSVNDRFGREAGDRTLREIADRLRTSCRSSDVLARFGSAIFACVLPDTPREAGREVAERTRVRLTSEPFLDGALRLSFSAGVVACDPRSERPENAVEVVRRAHQALSSAKRAGGGTTLLWDERGEDEELRALDRLSGIFTGSLSKDYRNISLLWDAVSAMAGAADFSSLAAKFLEGLMGALRPRQVALVDRTEAGGYELVHGLVRRAGAGGAQRVETGATLGPAEIALVEACRRDRKVVRATLPAAPDAPAEALLGCCVPLVSGGRFLGALYLDGPAETFRPDSSDMMLLGGLASPLAVARDRALLAEQQRRRAEEERRLLETELENLRRSLQESRLLHRSHAMDVLLVAVRRVAPTDATVLITGESGTGKELLARTLHEMSPRRKSPFVLVDCGALPATLMESELFGHERGAFTGAEGRRGGRLAEAEHGTVVLDEIGELPLEVQSKLLRFVQERQLTPVGGRSRPVDARLVAVTHRDLRGDVAAGRFRQDLFYRLNVVHLDVPPLRERPEDVLHLAEHYLERYALLYGRPVRRLSAEAEAAALRHTWPGNVRELQNRIMQAVILCEGEEIQTADLLGQPAPGSVAPAITASAGAGNDTEAPLWSELRESLTRSLEEAIGLGPAAAPALGRWLEEDLVVAAHAAAGGVLRRAATLAGLPEATFRRRYEQATHAATRGLAARGLGWSEVRSRLQRLVQTPPASGVSRLDQIGEELLRLVESHATAELRLRCVLMGITPPTYRRRVAALGARTNDAS